MKQFGIINPILKDEAHDDNHLRFLWRWGCHIHPVPAQHSQFNSVQGLEQVHLVRRKPACIPSLAKSLALSLQ